jgi:hypothetical protein
MKTSVLARFSRKCWFLCPKLGLCIRAKTGDMYSVPPVSLTPAARDRVTGGLLNIQKLSQTCYLLDFWEIVAGTPGRRVEATS